MHYYKVIAFYLQILIQTFQISFLELFLVTFNICLKLISNIDIFGITMYLNLKFDYLRF